MSYKPKVKTAPKKEMYFVIWLETEYDYGASTFNSYEEAKQAAEEFLQENDINGFYYIAKAIEKLYYKAEIEIL